MGYMTEISILNDRWEEIRDKPVEFVEQIYNSSMSYGRYPDYIIGQTTVARTHHADDIRIYYAGQNSFCDVYPAKNESLQSLKIHLKFIKTAKAYIQHAEKITKEAISKLEESEKK